MAQDKAFDKKHKELNDTLKEVAIKMNSAYAVFKRSAIDIHKEYEYMHTSIFNDYVSFSGLLFAVHK